MISMEIWKGKIPSLSLFFFFIKEFEEITVQGMEAS